MIITKLRGQLKLTPDLPEIEVGNGKTLRGILDLQEDSSIIVCIPTLAMRKISDGDYVEAEGYVKTSKDADGRLFTFFMVAILCKLNAPPESSGRENYMVDGIYYTKKALHAKPHTGGVELNFTVFYKDESGSSIPLHCEATGDLARYLETLPNTTIVRLRGVLDCKGGPILLRVEALTHVDNKPFAGIEE